MLRPCIAHLPRSQKLNLLCCLCFVLILHGAEVFSAHSSAQQRTAASTAIVELRLNLLMSYNVNEHKRAKRWTALLFFSSKPKPSELQLRKGALLRRTPRSCSRRPRCSCRSRWLRTSVPQLRSSSARPLAGPLVSRRRAKGLERRADKPPLKTSGAWPRCSRPAVWMMRHHPQRSRAA